jgi:hypothetical protein
MIVRLPEEDEHDRRQRRQRGPCRLLLPPARLCVSRRRTSVLRLKVSFLRSSPSQKPLPETVIEAQWRSKERTTHCLKVVSKSSSQSAMGITESSSGPRNARVVAGGVSGAPSVAGRLACRRFPPFLPAQGRCDKLTFTLPPVSHALLARLDRVLFCTVPTDRRVPRQRLFRFKEAVDEARPHRRSVRRGGGATYAAAVAPSKESERFEKTPEL